MKKLLYIFLISGFVVGSCSPKEESPEPVTKQDNTNNTGGGNTGGGNTGGGNTGGGNTNPPVQPSLTTDSLIQFWGIVDGTEESYKNGIGFYEPYTERDSIEDSGLSYSVYSGGIRQSGTPPKIAVIRGTASYPVGSGISEADFLNFFQTGTLQYSGGEVEIDYFSNSNSNQYNTDEGDQTGSTFEIIEVISTGTPAAPKCKAVIKFTCKVYNVTNPTDVIEIKDGIVVAEFSAY